MNEVESSIPLPSFLQQLCQSTELKRKIHRLERPKLNSQKIQTIKDKYEEQILITIS